MSQVLNLPTAVSRIADSLRTHPDSHFFIVGAGISCPEVPLSEQLIRTFVKEVDRKPLPRPDLSKATTPLKEYSAWFEAAFGEPQQRADFLRELIAPQRISHANFRLAHLLSVQPSIRPVVTPNFDDFLARGLHLFGTPCRSLDTVDAIRGATYVDFAKDPIHVLQVHGTYVQYDAANLEYEVENSGQIKDVLSGILAAKAPLVIGYAGWDGDVIMAALKERLSRGRTPANYYWFLYKRSERMRLPAWLRDAPQVRFVEPEAEDETLEAATVFHALIDGISTERHMFAKDPLGTFIKRMRDSLPRLERPSDADAVDRDLYLFSQRVLGLYANRELLVRDYNPIRIMDIADPAEPILVVGRTLIGWCQCFHEMKHFASTKGLTFEFLISDCDRYLPHKQVTEVKKDRALVRDRFLELAKDDPDHFRVRTTEQQVFDGVTFATVREPGWDKPEMIALFDINAAAGRDKATLALRCTCPPSERCTVHGLRERTETFFKQARSIRGRRAADPETVALRHTESLSARNNEPGKYRARLVEVFASASDPELPVPPPLCVQLQVASGCSTSCKMCEHWREPTTDFLELSDWKLLLSKLGERPRASEREGLGTAAPSGDGGRGRGRSDSLRVRAVILSGGEPLANVELPAILRAAREAGLEVGLLTNGIVSGVRPEQSYEDRLEEVVEAVIKNVSWVAVSVDEIDFRESHIRKPLPERTLLHEFCRRIGDASDERKPVITATVTLQAANIDIDRESLCRYIGRLGIPQVNFKFATGSTHALGERLNFLLEPQQVEEFQKWLLTSSLPAAAGNNLAYLRRCLLSGVFGAADVSKGCPVRGFYESGQFRCFTPYLFALVDPAGRVYPCCHLYRDNHGAHPRSRAYRQCHCMGDLRKVDFDFMRVWNGEAYERERLRLSRIDPKQEDFYPCGECTRHYVHNRALTELYDCYRRNRDEFCLWARPRGSDLEGDGDPVVWL